MRPSPTVFLFRKRTKRTGQEQEKEEVFGMCLNYLRDCIAFICS